MVDHKPTLSSPWYAGSRDGTMLHRYLDDQFMERFTRESESGQLRGREHQAWLQEDRFGRDRVTLRLPIHRTFYMACCEVSCDFPGSPAFDPAKIISAGMVVRKGTPSRYQTWQVRDGVALGWREAAASDLTREPDHYRRLVAKKLIETAAVTPPYSGEQTHPMHTKVISDASAQRTRSRTMVYGYVPLSGSVEANLARDQEPARKNARSETIYAAGQLAEHEWPFGAWDGVSDDPVCTCSGTLDSVVKKMCDHFSWTSSTALQVNNHRPTRALAEVIRTLINRYQLFDNSVPDNQALRNLCNAIFFTSKAMVLDEIHGRFQMESPRYDKVQSSGTLLDYITSHVDELHDYFAAVDKDKRNRAKSGSSALASYPLLPGNPGFLYITETQAADFRELLVLRAERAEELLENSLSLPRYTQGDNDFYFLKPFVRYRDDCGCEQVVWGPESQSFRVASPLDAEATRPTAIQLPELKDVKKSFKKGVTFLTPKDMADAIASIVPDLEFEKQDKKNHLDACLGFSISFSIPIITICAMILLMIILSLLNFIFRWLPNAILILPRLCSR